MCIFLSNEGNVINNGKKDEKRCIGMSMNSRNMVSVQKLAVRMKSDCVVTSVRTTISAFGCSVVLLSTNCTAAMELASDGCSS
uniref:Ovule protein n=1 Tax=Syphacia muris TaxID=451379 RepID=A0A0N5AYA0_9BILA